MKNPDAGDLVKGAGGVRKVRIADPARGKGKRGGYRVIHLNVSQHRYSLLITFYGKGEVEDLTQADRDVIRGLVRRVLESK